MSALVVAVDGGGSKTDVVAITLDGDVLRRVSGPGSSPHLEGLAGSVAIIDGLVRAAVGDAIPAAVGIFLSGIDLPVEEEHFRDALVGLPWSVNAVVENDLFALLRAGTEEPDAIAIVCGTGINAVGVRRDGAQVRFLSMGSLSGDWGGGTGLGAEALWHAARAVDGRGPATGLVEVVCATLGVGSIPELIEDLHFERRSYSELATLAPGVFEAADAGDVVAGALVDRQADEIVAYVRAITGRLNLAAVPVVLGGGILQGGRCLLLDRIAAGVAEVAPGSRLVHAQSPPVTGAALRTLERAGASPKALRHAQLALGAG